MTTPHADLARQLGDGIAAAPDAASAMDLAVRQLAASMPYYDWTGIYLLEGETLVLGPYVGKPSPHARIPIGEGICGAAARERATIVVDDVNADPRYLACSLETRSEIVVPILHAGRVLGEIDVDSHAPAAFGPADRALLETLAAALATRLAERQHGNGGPDGRQPDARYEPAR